MPPAISNLIEHRHEIPRRQIEVVVFPGPTKAFMRCGRCDTWPRIVLQFSSFGTIRRTTFRCWHHPTQTIRRILRAISTL